MNPIRKPWEILAMPALCLAFSMGLYANPSMPVVTQGSASFATQGSALTIHTSSHTAINWQSFNIASGESTIFVQPSATSVVLNRIDDPNPSQILGHLDANGYVILENENGFAVGGEAAISARGLVLTTAHVSPIDVFGGGAWSFTAPPPTASIVNYGQIHGVGGAPIFLIAHDIQNHGEISSPGGNIGLFAGKQVMVSSRPDGRGLSAQVKLPEGSVDNTGSLIADAGTIALRAQVVNEGGMIEANSVRERNGTIEIVASDSLNLSSSSVIQANGGSQSASSGGNIALKAGNVFSDEAGSTISVAGGANGGSGGVVEISAPSMGSINSTIDGHANNGAPGGHLVIDPTTINLGSSGTDSAGSGTVTSGSSPSALNLNVNSAFAGFSQIDLQATGDINLTTSWFLADSTGKSGRGCELTLEAGRNITLSTGVTLNGGSGWAITLEAGRDFTVANTIIPGTANTAAAGTVISGTGSVALNGAATIQTQDGSISVLAGNSISVGSGAIRTVGGGSIDATAISGSVNTGNDANGYIFKPTGPISGSLGGISTAEGGNVNIAAGGNVTSFLPPAGNTSSPTDAGSGAFGAEPGIVTVTAGGNVTGHFVAADSQRNGTLAASTITAENGSAGTSGAPLALSLAKGGWTVSAPKGDIYLQEVRNPDGVFNGSGSGLSAALQHVFNYDPNSFVDLEAPKGGVYLEGTLLPRYTGDQVPVIFPPTLTIHSGAGGITLQNNLSLFPSPDGELNVSTAGTLQGNGFTFAMSDSGQNQWRGPSNANPTDFSADHAATPVQLNNPNPVVFSIGGDCDNVTIVTPKQTEITVKGNMNNTSFSGQNLHSTDTSSLNVAGSIFNQNIYSFVNNINLTLPPPLYGGSTPGYLQVLQNAVIPGSGPNSANAGSLFPSLSLFYLSATHQLGYYGQMDSTTEAWLDGANSPLQEKTYEANGKPMLDANGNYVTTPVTFAVEPSALQQLYTASQSSISPSATPLGYLIGGPGAFDLSAGSLDLGVTGGIVSEGPAINHNLARIAKVGATINIDLGGDLTLFASQISSLYGGTININTTGAINAGLQNLPFAPSGAPRGIWSSGQSDISVIADGNIDVAGSRIAAFNGGNILVESRNGNVDAGTGNFSEVLVNEVVVNPTTFAVSTLQQPIAGSGILATTFPNAPSSLAVGNITILTPKGNINASLGGIAQEPENLNASLSPTITLTAGARDAQGNIVDPGNIVATGSGIIGINTDLNAAGSISGFVVARGNSTVNAAANVQGTFLAGGAANFSAGGTVSGIAIAGGSISVGSGSFQGVALSQSVSGGGAVTALASTATAASSSQNAAASQTDSQKTTTSDALATAVDADDLKRGGKRPLLAKYTGRVTVILPKAK